MRVIKHREHGIGQRVVLLDDAGGEIEPVNGFLSHLTASNYSPNTLCAYAYDLAHLVRFLEQRSLAWNDFRPSTALELLATVQRVLAATSSFFEWAIAAEHYTAGENPMQRRVDHALGQVPDRHQPFVGAPSRQQPVRRTVRVRLPMRLPRPMAAEDIDALLASLATGDRVVDAACGPARCYACSWTTSPTDDDG